MIDIIGIVSICVLIEMVNIMSVIFFAIGIGILGAINFLVHKNIPINKGVLITLEVSSTLLISLSLLEEIPNYLVLFIAIGMLIFYFQYNMKNVNTFRAIILLLVACFFICFAFFYVLDIFRFLLFTICITGYLFLIYFKRPCIN